jgi:hypothetical protein
LPARYRCDDRVYGAGLYLNDCSLKLISALSFIFRPFLVVVKDIDKQKSRKLKGLQKGGGAPERLSVRQQVGALRVESNHLTA